MNTEHHNGKKQVPELPRVIKEKPIVYDDGHLQEIREIAALPPIHLSPDEIEYAISLFAPGFARGDVVIGRSAYQRPLPRLVPAKPPTPPGANALR